MQETQDNFQAAPQPPVPQQPAAAIQTEQDNSFWIKFIIFFTPWASYIFYLLKRDDEPIIAKKALGTGWFAVKFWTVVMIVIFALYFLFFFFAIIGGIFTAATVGSGW